ncbi:hypothetical protein C8Q74DRAFT_376092 [Fomes fomentarius]|nr:hypothetical protein C8Q74DRAFT_376092 [Fomes fomentarius]
MTLNVALLTSLLIRPAVCAQLKSASHVFHQHNHSKRPRSPTDVTGSINEDFAEARETQAGLRVRATPFDPVEPARIATGCEDGQVRI